MVVLAIGAACGERPAVDPAAPGNPRSGASASAYAGPYLSAFDISVRCLAIEDRPGFVAIPCWSDRSRLAAATLRARRDWRTQQSPEALHRVAVGYLVTAPLSTPALNRTTSLLEKASREAHRPGPILADLSASYLLRAQISGDPRDLFAAVEAAERALLRQPGLPAARFNRALALQRIGLVDGAGVAWNSFLRVDSMSPWSAAARSQLAQVRSLHRAPPPPTASAPDTAFARFAAADPQGARMLGWCEELGGWARESQAGAAATAERHLTRAEVLGRELAARGGGDASLADAVRAIRRGSGAAERRRLVAAHRDFADGCALAAKTDFPAAMPRFRGAARVGLLSPTLAAWARVMYGDMRFHSGFSHDGERVLRRAIAAADTVRHPALAARAHQGLAALLLRSDRYVSGLQEAGRAAQLFARAGEGENQGVATDAVGAAQFQLRNLDEGYRQEFLALQLLAPQRDSYRLHNLLAFLARMVADDGFPLAALWVQDEGVGVATRTRNPIFIAEARLQRAQLRAAAGRMALAREDVEAGRLALAHIEVPVAHAWMTALFQMAQAATTTRQDLPRTSAALDSAAEFLLSMHASLVAFPAVMGGANARLQQGDLARATARLESALALLEERRDSIRMEPRRAAVFEAARSVVDRVAMLRLAAGDSVAALDYLDRGRASLAPVGRGSDRPAQRAVAGPPEQVVIEYGLVGDTLLAWAVRGRGVTFSRTTVNASNLRREIQRVRDQLQGLSAEAVVRPGLAALYERLIRPLASSLGAAGLPVVVIADGDLAAVPFAALYDAPRRRYLVEDHPLRFAANLGEARVAPRPARRTRRAVLVANPAFDATANPGFAPLRGAAAEVSEIGRVYARATTLPDAQATLPEVRRALGQATVFHYAGHAVFDDERPERSYLLLAASSDSTAETNLRADAIADLDLRQLSLVVLAACQTVRTGNGRAAGFSGLAGAFVAAGAGGAVGSLWQADDRLTRALMVEFHRAYAVSGDAAGALRTAQLSLLRSSDGSLRSPAAWAGFRYMGS